MHTPRACRASLALLLLFCGSCFAKPNEAYAEYKNQDTNDEIRYKDLGEPEQGYYKRYDAGLEQGSRRRPWKEEIPEWTFSDGPEPKKQQPSATPAAAPTKDPSRSDKPSVGAGVKINTEEPSNANPESKEELQKPLAAAVAQPTAPLVIEGPPGPVGPKGQPGKDGQLCASGTRAYSYTLPISTNGTAVKGPLGLSGSCPRSTTLGGSCKFSCKDPRNADRVLVTETRLVSSPPQDWANVSVADMPVFCKWDLRKGRPLRRATDVPEKFECEFAVRIVCCGDTAPQLAPTSRQEVELNPALRGLVVKTASEADMGVQVEGIAETVMVKISGPDAAELASVASRK